MKHETDTYGPTVTFKYTNWTVYVAAVGVSAENEFSCVSGKYQLF